MDNQTNHSYSLTGQCFISSIQRNTTIPILLIFAIPSLICFLFIFYYVFKHRKKLIINSINHHAILFILILDFLLISTELPITLSYLGLGNIQTRKICLFWIYWDYTLETTSLFLVMYASIERYLLTFAKYFIHRHEYILHYIPLTCFSLYIPILYFYLVVLSPCAQNHPYDTTAFACGGACFFSYTAVNTYDTFANTMFPCLTLLLFNLLIILHVTIIKAKALRQTSLLNILKRNRRMILQLLGISLMSLIAWMPWVVIIIAQNFFQPSFGDWFITYILHYLPYLTTSVSPFLALIGLPEVKKHLRALVYEIKPTSRFTGSIAVKQPISKQIYNQEVIESTNL